MKKIIYVFLFFALIACNEKGNNSVNTIAPELGRILDEYISDNPNNKIYYLIFENRCDKQFFTIQSSSSHYDSDYVDGCFMWKGHIIVFWSVNKSWKDSLLNIPQEELCFDSLERYTDFKDLGSYDAPYNPITYRILSANHLRKTTTNDWAYPEPACDSNAIYSSAMNKIVNDYINTYDSPSIVYLRFSNLDGADFVAIGQDFTYNPESFSGMFYRNKRIVVVYSIDNLKQTEVIDKQALLPIHEIYDYKSQKRDFPRFSEKKYRIVSKETIRPVSSNDKNWMNI